jgi:hypothetical protein
MDSSIVSYHVRCATNRWIQTARSNSKNAVSFSSARLRTDFHRRDVRLQSRLFVSWNPSQRRQPQLQPALLRLSAIIPNTLGNHRNARFLTSSNSFQIAARRSPTKVSNLHLPTRVTSSSDQFQTSSSSNSLQFRCLRSDRNSKRDCIL